MLGYNKALQLHQGWGISNEIRYQPLSILERQVYHPHQVAHVMTTKRLVTLVTLRPVDQLVALLKSLVERP